MTNILIILLAYIVGSIPFSVIVSKLFYKDDIRKYGSGNPGGTNVMRIFGISTGAIVILLDMIKGYVMVSSFNEPNIILFVGAFVVIGHVWSVFLNFEGGKGIATSFGVFLYLMPIETLIAFALFLFIVWKYRYVSLGSILSFFAFPFIIILSGNTFEYFMFALSAAFLITYTHTDNIGRLIAGVENKIKF